MRSHSVHYLNNSKMFKSNSIRKYILKSDLLLSGKTPKSIMNGKSPY